MKKFIEEHELEVLLLFISVIGITRWWIPSVRGFELMYGASQWALSYDHGILRRGLIGTLMKLWVPILSIEDVHRTAFIAYCFFLLVLLAVFYFLLRYKEKNGQLFRLILFFLAAPVTISLVARDLSRFDLFLTMLTLFSMILLSLKKCIWLIPVFIVLAMFIHESFLVLYTPTIAATLLFVYVWNNNKEKRILATLIVSILSVAAAFFILYQYGNPTLGCEEFSRLIQSRATFNITPLSMSECYFSINDHYHLASSSLYDAGSIANLVLALLMLTPVILVLLNLWMHAFRNCGDHRIVCRLLLLATLSGLMVVPIATDYGRWLSAVVFCNFFVIFFFISRDIIKIEELAEYTGSSFKPLFVIIIFTYLLFGPFHDWNPYPYRDNVLVSSLAISSVLLFDIVFSLRWRTLLKQKE
jgi:hypothetical protein